MNLRFADVGLKEVIMAKKKTAKKKAKK